MSKLLRSTRQIAGIGYPENLRLPKACNLIPIVMAMVLGGLGRGGVSSSAQQVYRSHAHLRGDREVLN